MIVTEVEEESAASSVLTKGDIIVEINRKTVENLSQYFSPASKIEKGQGVVLLIVRNNAYQYVTVPGAK